MKEYNVTFVQYHEYIVEANSEEEARQKAIPKFRLDMYRSVANTHYDDCEIECLDEE